MIDAAFDEMIMNRALELSLKGRVTAPPNPWVGCVIVNKGKIVGEGYHRAAGEPHAEMHALIEAKGKTRGATAYVTLEPCSHFGRTPPCSKGLIDANIERVVIGIQDPDPKVQGRGIAQLCEAGLKVSYGILEDKITRALAPYLYHRKTGMAYCLAKGAISIDGRIAAADGTSQWITSEEAQRDSHQLRAESQAIMVGAGTACFDNPMLTVRHIDVVHPHPPLRVVLDAEGKVNQPKQLLNTSLAPTLIATTESCPKKVLNFWKKCGVEVLFVPKATNQLGVDLKHVLKHLGSRGILQVLVEGGGTLLGSLLDEKLIQHFVLYIGPRILGSGGIPLFRSDSITSLHESPSLLFSGSKICGETVRIDYDFKAQIEKKERKV